MQQEKFQQGDRISVLSPIDLLPYTILAPGEKGTVVRIVDDMGIVAVEVKLDQQHDGLKLFDNIALLTWPETAYLTNVSNVEFRPRRALIATILWGGVATTMGTLKAHAATLAVLLAHSLLPLG